jgi:predicted nucleic acid-binding protein
MNYLLDTCILSEFTRREPDKRVIQSMNGIDEEKLFLSVITIGEIQRGIERLPESHRKNELIIWLNDGLVDRFDQRVVDIDTPIMFLWGLLTARMETIGQPMAIMDSLIAATALDKNLIVATRNTLHFRFCGAQVVNPCG